MVRNIILLVLLSTGLFSACTNSNQNDKMREKYTEQIEKKFASKMKKKGFVIGSEGGLDHAFNSPTFKPKIRFVIDIYMDYLRGGRTG